MALGSHRTVNLGSASVLNEAQRRLYEFLARRVTDRDAIPL